MMAGLKKLTDILTLFYYFFPTNMEGHKAKTIKTATTKIFIYQDEGPRVRTPPSSSQPLASEKGK